jgi:hypothetical protein
MGVVSIAAVRLAELVLRARISGLGVTEVERGHFWMSQTQSYVPDLKIGGELVSTTSRFGNTANQCNRFRMGPDTWSTWKCEFHVKPIFGCLYSGV